jgi:hypothetical protein
VAVQKRAASVENGCKRVELDILFTSAPLQRVALHGCGGILGGDKRIAVIPICTRSRAFSLTSGSLVAVSSMGHPQSIAVMHQVKSAMLRSGPLPEWFGEAPAREMA